MLCKLPKIATECSKVSNKYMFGNYQKQQRNVQKCRINTCYGKNKNSMKLSVGVWWDLCNKEHLINIDLANYLSDHSDDPWPVSINCTVLPNAVE
jgi:hypothetical protein